MRRNLGLGLRCLTAILFLSTGSHSRLSSSALQVTRPLEQIPGTTLKVALPVNWKLEPARSPWANLLKHTGKPEYALTISQTTSGSLGRSCMDLIGFMQEVQKSIPQIVPTVPRPASKTSSQIVPRPTFIPERYFGSVVDVYPQLLVTCLSTGAGMISVEIEFPGDDDPRPDVLTAMLAAIGDAGLRQSKAVSSPGTLKLPLLGIEIPIRSGAWGVREGADGFGKNDVLGRAATSRSNELIVTPFIF